MVAPLRTASLIDVLREQWMPLPRPPSRSGSMAAVFLDQPPGRPAVDVAAEERMRAWNDLRTAVSSDRRTQRDSRFGWDLRAFDNPLIKEALPPWIECANQGPFSNI
jgi:hypothetical protein